MKAIEHHLYIRGRYYYYRSALPQNLHQVFSRKEVCVSLQTQDRALARLYVAKLDIEIQNLIHQVYDARDIEAAQNIIMLGIEGMKGKVGLPQRQSFNLGLLSSSMGGAHKPFSQVAREYLNDCVTNSPKTIEHKRQTYEIFQSICGDVSFNSIAKNEARKFKAVMLKTPANLTKILGVRSYKNVDWDNLPKKEPQSLVTVNNRLIAMTSLFMWGERNDLFKGKNPFSGLIISKAKKHANKRPPFSNQQLQTLFSYLMDTDRVVTKDYKYWIPLIGLYTGMRLNEICQLLVSDIMCVDGVWIINIDDNDHKKLKTASSRRRIPVHKRLIDLGLLAYVKEQDSPRLFKSLPVSGQGSYSYKFSKEFTSILKSLGLKEQGLCFHSFRHTFIDGLRNAGVEKSIAMKLVGHHNSNDVHNGYGYGHSLEVLQEHINKLSFPVLLKRKYS